VKQYQWPVFNLADSAIVIGASLLVLEILLVKPQPADAHSKSESTTPRSA